jgi:hypothetical protein
MNKPTNEPSDEAAKRKGLSRPIVDEHDRPHTTSPPDHERDERDALPPSRPAE